MDLLTCLLTYLLFCFVLCTVPSGYPRIVESPTLKAVEKDRNTVMLCSATGDPAPTISWLKDYVPVDLADTRFKVLPTGKTGRALLCVPVLDYEYRQTF